jgi:hypothetical protein
MVKGNTAKERYRKSDLMKLIEMRNDKLYIGKDEKVLKYIDNLIELAFLIEAINSRRLMQLCKKKETNTQRRAIRRINLGIVPFKKSKCRKLVGHSSPHYQVLGHLPADLIK